MECAAGHTTVAMQSVEPALGSFEGRYYKRPSVDSREAVFECPTCGRVVAFSTDEGIRELVSSKFETEARQKAEQERFAQMMRADYARMQQAQQNRVAELNKDLPVALDKRTLVDLACRVCGHKPVQPQSILSATDYPYILTITAKCLDCKEEAEYEIDPGELYAQTRSPVARSFVTRRELDDEAKRKEKEILNREAEERAKAEEAKIQQERSEWIEGAERDLRVLRWTLPVTTGVLAGIQVAWLVANRASASILPSLLFAVLFILGGLFYWFVIGGQVLYLAIRHLFDSSNGPWIVLSK